MTEADILIYIYPVELSMKWTYLHIIQCPDIIFKLQNWLCIADQNRPYAYIHDRVHIHSSTVAHDNTWKQTENVNILSNSAMNMMHNCFKYIFDRPLKYSNTLSQYNKCLNKFQCFNIPKAFIPEFSQYILYRVFLTDQSKSCLNKGKIM